MCLLDVYRLPQTSGKKLDSYKVQLYLRHKVCENWSYPHINFCFSRNTKVKKLKCMCFSSCQIYSINGVVTYMVKCPVSCIGL